MIVVSLVRRSVAQSLHVLVPFVLLVAAFQLILVGQAASIDATRSFDRMAELLPAFLRRGAGNDALVLASFKGIVTLGYFHPVIAVVASVMAINMASGPAHDVESGVVDLVLARSIPRHRLITRSLLLSTGSSVAGGLAMACGTWVGLHAFASPSSDWPTPGLIVRLVAHLVAVTWCFGTLGLAVAAGARRWSAAFASVSFAMVAMYLLDFVGMAWPAARTVSWISPFHYYPALPIVAGTARGGTDLVVLLSASAVFTLTAYWRFSRRDL